MSEAQASGNFLKFSRWLKYAAGNENHYTGVSWSSCTREESTQAENGKRRGSELLLRSLREGAGVDLQTSIS